MGSLFRFEGMQIGIWPRSGAVAVQHDDDGFATHEPALHVMVRLDDVVDQIRATDRDLRAAFGDGIEKGLQFGRRQVC